MSIKATEQDELQLINELIKEHINPQLAQHGGSCEAAHLENGELHIRMSGGCQGCAMAKATLNAYITRVIKHFFPCVTEVVDVTEHAQGLKPYYKEKKEDEGKS